MKIRLMPVVVISAVLFCYGCTKSSPTITPPANKVITPPDNVNLQIVYALSDTITEKTELWTVNSDGTGNSKIAVNGIPPNLAIGIDNFMAAVSTDYKTMAVLAADETGTISNLYRCNINGSSLQQIASPNDYAELETFINTSSFLYLKQSYSVNGELWKINTDGSGNQKINFVLPANSYLGDSRVTDDGKTIVLMTGLNFSHSTSIYKCNIDGSGLTPVVSDDELNLESLSNNNTIVYSKYNEMTSTYEIWLVGLDGSNKHQVSITTLPAGLTLNADAHVRISNNNVLVFEALDSNDTQYIFSANIDGSNVKLVTKIALGYEGKIQFLLQ